MYLKKEEKTISNITTNLEYDVINIYPDITYQTWHGFGSSLTEAACYNLKKLDIHKYNSLLKDCFCKSGLNYNLIRIPIGSCDFSLNSHRYSFENDKKILMPIINDILSYKPFLKIMASPWTPPKEWKTNMKINGGHLKKDNYQLYADYLSNFVVDYCKEGINIDFLSIQNEPNASQIWESCLFTPKEEATFLGEYLISNFKKKKLKTRILLWDHNKDCLYKRVNDTLKNNNLSSKIFGIAYHWYSGSHLQNLELINKKYPKLFLYSTESCCGYSQYNELEWVRDAELIGLDILFDMNNYMNAHIDWNLVLDYNGGPNHADNYCKAPIILNKNNDDYIKTPIYYYLMHFSKYIRQGYKRIALSKYSETVCVTAFKKDKQIVIVIINPFDYKQKYNVCIKNKYFYDEISEHSIVTYIL